MRHECKDGSTGEIIHGVGCTNCLADQTARFRIQLTADLYEVLDFENDEKPVYRCTHRENAEHMAETLNEFATAGLPTACGYCGSALYDRGDGPECAACGEKGRGE